MGGDDLIGQARTGTGKTLGFGVPLLQRLAGAADDERLFNLDGTPRALIVVPTRELCIQVTDDLETASTHLPIRITSIFGGRPYEGQIADLKAGVDVVVGTPGRLIDLANQGHLILGKVQILVLDEADEMLDLGFLPDIERIIAALPDAKQSMLFSATMPGPIVTLARSFQKHPTHIRAEHVNESAVHERTTQHIYRAHALDKAELVARILQAEGRGATMIFTRTKRTAQKVSDDLVERGFKAGAVHGDLGQIAREKALKKFRSGDIDVLVATDVAARGIDIDDVTHVINYQCPDDEKTYVHRIGRTGRAGRTGIAITLVDWDELHRWELIDKALDLGVPEPVETYSSSAHLREELNIPEGATGRLVPASEDAGQRPSRGRRGDGEETRVRAGSGDRPKSNRSRRRTRGGRAAGGDTATAAAGDTSTKSTGTESTGTGADSAAANESAQTATTGDQPARRRRRRRKPKSAASAPTADQSSGTESAGE
jgi:superfamily II DNA/RNA helicase